MNENDYKLNITEFGTELISLSNSFTPFKIDFSSTHFQRRRLQTSFAREPIAKALGVVKDAPPRILDLTAGIGRDAFILACYGCKVTMLESNRIVHALLFDGLQRGQADKDIENIVSNMILHQQDSLAYLQQYSSELLSSQPPIFDAIYFDPMFPEKKKSAKSKKELQILQDLVPPVSDEENNAILQTALSLNPPCKRIVVKRPKNAPFILKKPDVQQNFETIRFDIYFPKQKPLHN